MDCSTCSATTMGPRWRNVRPSCWRKMVRTGMKTKARLVFSNHFRAVRGGNGLPGTGHGRRRISIIESFNYAVEGIIHVLRTHRNMRIHLAAAVLVLVLAL